MTLADLYDADKRMTNAEVRDTAASVRIPHPLRGVQYADGIEPCTHGKRHGPFELCRWTEAMP